MSLLVMLLAFPLVPADKPEPARLLCCGGPEVFLIAADIEKPAEKDRSWRWRAADSPEIPREMHTQFRTTDECKPCGDFVLITASSGGVALVRRKDKSCAFFTSAKNAHSACLLPGERLAVAASYGGDEMRIYALDRSGADVAPLARLELKGAHGALWDNGRQRLWALGEKELLLLELRGKGKDTELKAEKRWDLPTAGGHDLAFARDGRYLLITTNTKVYRFDGKEGRFDPLRPLADQGRLKSVDEHPTTGAIVYHQGQEKEWWSDTIRFADDEKTIRIQGERFYKARWDVDRGMPK